MSTTPEYLYGGIVDARVRWKTDVTWHSLGEPLGERFPGGIFTSGTRWSTLQKKMADDPLYAAKVARNKDGSLRISQHELGEALDWDHNRRKLIAAYLWAHSHLPWWQLIIYFKHPEPETGLGESLHLSILSESPTIERKALYQVNGTWHNFDGTFQHLPQVA